MGTNAAVKATRSAIFSRIEEERSSRGILTKVPAGAITVDDYAEQFGVARQTAGRELERMAKAGKLKTGVGKNETTHKWTRYWWLP